MTSKVRVSNSQIDGNGVFATTDLSVGEVVLTIDDSHIVDNDGIPGKEDIYWDYIGGGKVIEMQTPERYINHSCDPNVFIKTQLHGRQIIVLRTIRAGEEITYHYSINGLGDTVWTCNCQSSRCGSQIHSNFFQLPTVLQQEYLPLLDDWFRDENAERIKSLQLG